MLGGVVLGLVQELTNSPLAGFVVEMLRRAADPWAVLLGIPSAPAQMDLAELFPYFGYNATSLLEPRKGGIGDGPTEEAVETMLVAYEQHGRSRRQPQERLANLAGQAFLNQSFAIVEAGTGTGKGLGYLAPAYLQAKASGQPVVISTFTRVLQDQLYKDDLDFLNLAVQTIMPGAPLKKALLKGRRNYLSSRCLAEEWLDASEEESLEPGRAWGLITLAFFAMNSSDGDLSAIAGSFSGLAGLIEKNHHTYLQLGQSLLPPGSGTDVWNLLERVRVTSEVPQAPWPFGLPRQRPDFFRIAQLNAQRADIVVVNHSLLLTKALKAQERVNSAAITIDVQEEEGLSSGLLSPYLVCDEAHTLEDAATMVLTQEVTLNKLRRVLIALIGHGGWREGLPGGLVRTCRNLGLTQDDPIVSRLQQESIKLVAQIKVLGQVLSRHIERQTVVNRNDRIRYGISAAFTRQALIGPGGPELRQAGQQFVELLEQLYQVLDELASPLARQAENVGHQRRAARAERIRLAAIEELDDLVTAARWFWRFWDETSTVRVIHFEPGEVDKADWSLRGMPIAVGARLYESLWSKLKAGVITSATLTSSGEGFDFFLQRVGLSRLEINRLVSEVLPHVFDYKANALFLMPNHLPTPRDTALRKAYPEAVAAELRRFIPFFKGRTLALFTARSRMVQVHEQVVSELEQAGYPILTQDEAEAIEKFKDDKKTSLLGVRSLWEGVNVPGESLSYVFIEKFPFPSLGDPLEGARMNAVERNGGDGFYQYLLPRAIFQFKQGFGRLIRSKDDRGAVIMLDKRLRSAMYRGEVLTSLPGPTIGYDSDIEMYRRISEWMGISFDPTELPVVAQSPVMQIIAENQLPDTFVEEADWEKVALPRLERVIRAVWGEKFDWRPFQIEAIRAVLAGRDVLTLAPTGSGKSLTYQLPALLREGCTIVISPLIALIRDQVTTLREVRGLPLVNCLISGMSAAEQEEVLSEAQTGRIRLLYIAPERLRDPRFRAALVKIPLVQLVVDEAHCISTWGHDFRPDFLEITSLLPTTNGQRVPIHGLTATATPQVQVEITTALSFGSVPGRPEPLIHSSNKNRDNLVYRVYYYRNAEEGEARTVEMVRQIVADQERGGAGIVYVARRASAERLAELLRNANISAYAYHAGLPSAERHNIQELFMNDEIQVVCCTNAFGMGVDKSSIRFVIHYDHPSSLEAYAQETGRAGRDEREAYAILLYNSATQRTHRSIARRGWQEQGAVSALLNSLNSLETNNLILTSFEVLSKSLDNMDEVALRVLLHNAEQVGLLRRGEDVVLQAGILLSVDPIELVNQLPDASAQTEAIRLFNYLVSPKIGQLGTVGQGIRLTYNALEWQAMGGDPFQAGLLLHHLSELEPEKLIFRPFSRGITLELANAPDSQAFTQLSVAFQLRYANFEQRLHKMLDYVDLPVGKCRQAFIENYLLGEQPRISQACGKCDQCAPSYNIPWNERLVEASLPTVVKTATASEQVGANGILEALRDHAGYFTRNTLVKMLLGESHGQSSAGGKYPISPTARNSEHFGALKSSRHTAISLQSIIERLIREGYIEKAARSYQIKGEQADYNALLLTALGRDVLAGELSLNFDTIQPLQPREKSNVQS